SIHRVEDILDSNAVGMMFLNDLLQREEDRLQLGRECVSGGRTDRARINVAKLASGAIDHPVAGDLAAAVDAEYDHDLLAAAPDGRAVFFLDEISIGFG